VTRTLTEPTPRAGVIGLGMIGGAVATRPAHTGWPLPVYDVRDGVSDTLPGVPAPHGSAREVAECSDVVIIAVVTPEQATDGLIGRDGLLTGDHGDLTIGLLSTVTLQAVQHLDVVCRERGAVLLDAGVTSGGGHAAEGGLVVMVSGAGDEIAAAMPVITGFARSVMHCGPLGTGMVAKLVRNAAQYGRWAVMAEAACLAAAGGVAPEQFLRVLEDDADGCDESLTWLQVRSAGFTRSPEQLAQELAAHLGVETAMTNLTRPRGGPAVRSAVPESLPDNACEGGITMMEEVMGDRIGALIRQAPRLPVLASTIEQLFAAIWSRISLTVRDRRLPAVGAAVMLGRTDLLTNDSPGRCGRGNSPPSSCASSVCSCTTTPAGATAPRWTPSWRN